MVSELIASKKAVYFSGCFANYYYPEVGEATVRVLRKNGVEIAVPEQVCCGLPLLAKGNVTGALKNIDRNAEILSRFISEGYALITTCSSCSLFLSQDYPRLVNSEKTEMVSKALCHISDYLLQLHEIGQLIEFQPLRQTVFYHTPCHLRAMQINKPTVRLLQLVPGIAVKKVSEECCGMGGAYGYEKANFELSRDIAGKLYEEVKSNPTDRIVTDCGGCRLQIESGTGRKVDHPIILVREAYRL